MTKLEEAASAAYKKFYTNMFNSKTTTHADISINFFKMGAQWLMAEIDSIEEASRYTDIEVTDFCNKIRALVE